MTFDQRDPVSPRQDSIRTLLQLLADKLDARIDPQTGQTGEAAIRPSDERIFLLLAGQPLTISKLARALGISRQAAHASIGRLAARNYVQLAHAPGSRRDKIATVTPEGENARAAAKKRDALIEADLETTIGGERLAELRNILHDLLQDAEA